MNGYLRFVGVVVLGAVVGCGKSGVEEQVALHNEVEKQKKVEVEPGNKEEVAEKRGPPVEKVIPEEIKTETKEPVKVEQKKEVKARVNFRSEEEMKYIEAIRQRPWETAVYLDYAKWLEDKDAPRAECIRLEVERAQLKYDDPNYRVLSQKIQALQNENLKNWTAPLADLLGEDSSNFASLHFGLIDAVELSEATDEQAKVLVRAPEVRHLTLNSPKLTAQGYALIGGLPQLDYLVIEAPQLDDESLAMLEKLPPWTALDIYLEERDVKKLDAMNERRIAPFHQFSAEEKMSATVRFLSGKGDLRWGNGMLDKLPVHALLGQSGIRDPEMVLLSGLPDLETVDISESDITSKGVTHLANLTKLTKLGLWDTKVQSINALSKLTKLKSLGIYPEYDTKMGDEGLAALDQFTELEDIYLNDETATDITLKRLTKLTKLRKLELSLGQLQDEHSLAALSGMKDLKTLSFHLEESDLSDAVLKHFASLTNLERLSIRIQHGTGEGFKELVGLKSLTDLFLSGKGVNDQAMQQLGSMKQLRVIMAQGSAVTPQGAKQLAEQLPRVTIILDKHVVKSPRESYTFERKRHNQFVSLLVPKDWESRNSYGKPEEFHNAVEDGWNKIGGWSGGVVGPAEFYLYVSDQSKTASDGMMESVNNNSHLNPKILSRDVVRIAGSDDVASCIYQNDHSQNLVCAAKVDGGILILSCQAPPARFAEFETLYKYIARSIRIHPDPANHVEQPVTTLVKDLDSVPK